MYFLCVIVLLSYEGYSEIRRLVIYNMIIKIVGRYLILQCQKAYNIKKLSFFSAKNGYSGLDKN